MKQLKIFISGMMAGLAISLGGTVFLSVDSKIIGALAFTVGLFSVCTRGLALYTGRVCYLFENDKSYALHLPLIWFGNLTGAFLTGALFFAATLTCSLFSNKWPIPFWGAGVFIGMLVGWTYSFFRIRWIERNLDTFIFCDYKVVDTMKSSNKGKVVYRKKERNAAG